MPEVTSVGTWLSVESDIAARPVHDRTRVRGTRVLATFALQMFGELSTRGIEVGV